MGKGEKNKEEEKIPSFIDQANALIDKTFSDAKKIEDPQYRPGLNIQDHKLWVSVMNLHVNHVKDLMCTAFIESISEHYEPIMRSLANLEQQQATIVEDIKSLKSDLTELSETHYKDVNEINSKLANDQKEIRLIKESIITGKKRVDIIEEEIGLLQPDLINKFLKRIDDVTPTLETIKIDQERILNGQRLRSMAVKYAIGIGISTLITWFTITIAFNMHNKRTIEILERLIPKTEITK